MQEKKLTTDTTYGRGNAHVYQVVSSLIVVSEQFISSQVRLKTRIDLLTSEPELLGLPTAI